MSRNMNPQTFLGSGGGQNSRLLADTEVDGEHCVTTSVIIPTFNRAALLDRCLA